MNYLVLNFNREQIRIGMTFRIEYCKLSFISVEFKFINRHPISKVKQAQFNNSLCLLHFIRVVVCKCCINLSVVSVQMKFNVVLAK